MLKSIFILGATDPEMQEIERFLLSREEMIVHAINANAKPVSPREAYQFAYPDSDTVLGYKIHLVECAPCFPGLNFINPKIFDHHRLGDPGYGKSPGEYLQGSSLGQILAFFGVEPTPEQKVIAAADHCLSAAYKGLCPGASREEVFEFRVKSRCEWQEKSEEQMRSEIVAASENLRIAPRVDFAGEEIADMRELPHQPELVEASMLSGIGYLSAIADRDGKSKLTISASPPAVEFFMKSWAPAQGLTGIYGDPVRGFAGGYLPESK